MVNNKVIGIVGSYRKDGVIDSVITEILANAAKKGAETEKIYLKDSQIEFCTNCRKCTQNEGVERGECIIKDDMESILDRIDSSNYLVIGAPVNFGNINALTQKFLERCIGYAYWPWGEIPKIRNKIKTKKAILVSASAAPAWMGRMFTRTIDSLKTLADLFGAKTIGVIWVGLVNKEQMKLSQKTIQKAKRLTEKLIAARSINRIFCPK